jgi:F-type H+-transporting ATPase subunit epsilon
VKLTVVTPEAMKLEQIVNSVTLPGGQGELGILPGHIALLSTLDVGILAYEDGGKVARLAVNRGFFEVNNDEVRVLTETCETPDDISSERAEDALKRAEARLAEAARSSEVDVDRASGALKRATARLTLSKSR